MSLTISIAQQFHKDFKKILKKGRMSSFNKSGSDDKITENGFPKWFENKVLKAEKSSSKNDIVLETEEDIHNYFLHLKKPKPKVRNNA